MTQTEAKRKLLMDQLQEWRRVHIKLEDRSQELDRSEESQFEAQRKKFSCHQCVLCQSSQQINGSKTEATLILCGYSGERANNRGDSTIKEEVRRRKIRKFASKQTHKEQSNCSNTEATLILCGYSGERANRGG